MKYKPHDYQVIAYDHLQGNPKANLFLDMGLGKTSVTLTLLKDLLYDREIWKPLIIAPKLVAEKTWSDEIKKWDHLKGLRISKIVGTPQQRIDAIKARADIYIVSRDNIAWLVGYIGFRKWPYDAIVVDELSSFKNRASSRFKALRKVVGKMRRFVGLTGTPLPNGYLDLWAQMYLLDKGERLGRTLTSYRDEYFRPGQRKGDVIYNYVPRKGSPKKIQALIKDVCLSMSAEDWLDMPDKINVTKYVELPELATYKKFEHEEILRLPGKGWTFEQYDDFTFNGVTGKDYIAPANAAALANKLQQFANGAVYDDDKLYHVVSEAKLDMLYELIEESNGKPVMVFYQFKSDVDRIKKRIKGVRMLTDGKSIDDWNAGKIPVFLLHAASAGHGLNLQFGGNYIIWFGVPWSLELYEQAVARIYRQGLTGAMINLHLITEGTIDEDILDRLREKGLLEDSFLYALK